MLVQRMDSLIIPDQSTPKDQEKRIKKKIQDHRRALNMLPDSEQFRSELVQFQQRLNKQSKAQKLVEKQGGFLHSPNMTKNLNFAKPGIDMNFGISHLDKQRDEERYYLK